MDATAIRQSDPVFQWSKSDHRALYGVAAVSVILLALMLPMLSWIRVINAEALFDAMKLKASAVKKLGSQYSVFVFLIPCLQAVQELGGSGLLVQELPERYQRPGGL